MRGAKVGVLLKTLAILGALFATQATAQDITWKLAQIKPGFSVKLAYDPGGIYTHKLRGQAEDLFVIDSYFADEQTPLFTVWVNAQGNYVGLRTREGVERRYQPHDCKRTIGQCTYTEIEGQKQTTFIRVTTPDGNRGYNYVQYDATGVQLQRGFIELDDFGTAGDGFAVDAAGNKTLFRLLGTTYPE